MGRLLERLIGHDLQKTRLERSLQEGRCPHSLLLSGPSGVGKRTMALALAQALLCRVSFTACGDCADCIRVAKGEHEGLLLIEPDKSVIKIESSERIHEFFRLKSWTRSRVVIINEAHFLNPQAGNSLLKLLEEPPEDSYFFLITSNLRHILSTLRSRSQVVKFEALSEDQLQSLVSAQKWMLRAARGSVERLQFLKKQDSDLRMKSGDWLKAVLAGEAIYLDPEVRDLIKQKSNAGEISQHWVTYLRDASIFKEQPNHIINLDQVPLLEELTQIPKDRLLRAAQKCLQWQQTLSGPRDGLLVFEQMCIEFGKS